MIFGIIKQFYADLHRDTKKFLLVMLMTIILGFSALSFFIGICVGSGSYSYELKKTIKHDCVSKNIATLINIPYRVGCELTKERW